MKTKKQEIADLEPSVKDGPSARLLRQMLGSAHADAREAEVARVARLAANQVEPLRQSETDRLAYADKLRASGNLADRTKAAGVERRVRRDRKAREEARALQARIAETVHLAELRGEQVEETPAGLVTRRRIATRDGLRSLFEAERLSTPAYEAGLQYRRLFEGQASGLRCQLSELQGGGRRQAGLWLDRWIEAKTVIVAFETIAAEQGPRTVETLRRVAGAGETMSAVARGKAAVTLTGKLVSTLEAAAAGRVFAVVRGLLTRVNE